MTEKRTDPIYGYCFVCHQDGSKIWKEGNNTVYECPNCGTVVVPDDPAIRSQISDNSVKIAGYLFEKGSNGANLTQEKLTEILSYSGYPRKPMDYLNKVVLNLYSCGSHFIREISDEAIPPSFGYAVTRDEMYQMLDELIDMGYVKKTVYSYMSERDDGCYDQVQSNYYRLTAKGIQYAESLLDAAQDSDKIFVAMDYSPELKSAYEKGIKPACKSCGMRAIRIDEKEHNDDIVDQIIVEIHQARFVIADFTTNNSGVYYEAGYAKGLGKEVIKLCQEKEFIPAEKKPHFDISHEAFIRWKDPVDLKKRLISRIQAMKQTRK